MWKTKDELLGFLLQFMKQLSLITGLSVSERQRGNVSTNLQIMVILVNIELLLDS